MRVHHLAVFLVLVAACGSTSGLAQLETGRAKARLMVRKVLQAVPDTPPQSGTTYGRPLEPSLEEVLGRQPSPTASDSDRDMFEAARANRQNHALPHDQALQQAMLSAHHCDGPDPLFGNDDPGLPLVTYDLARTEKHVLSPAMLVREDFIDAVTKPDQYGAGHVVVLTVADPKRLAQITGSKIGQRAAFALDGLVWSAHEIRGRVDDGEVEISGVLTEDEASRLAAKIMNG